MGARTAVVDRGGRCRDRAAALDRRRADVGRPAAGADRLRARARVVGSWRPAHARRAGDPAAGDRLGRAAHPHRRDLDHCPDRRLSRHARTSTGRSGSPATAQGRLPGDGCGGRVACVLGPPAGAERCPRRGVPRARAPAASVRVVRHRRPGIRRLLRGRCSRRDPRRRAEAHSSRRPSDSSSSRCVGTGSSSSTTSFQRRCRRPSCSSSRHSGERGSPEGRGLTRPAAASLRPASSPDHPIGSLGAPIGGGRHHPGSGSLG